VNIMEETKKEFNTEFEIRIPKKVVIHNVIKLDIKNILHFANTPMGVTPLMWANGYIIILYPLIQNNSYAGKLYLEGETHYTDLLYCELPKYQPKITAEENKYQEYVLIDVSGSPIYKGISLLLDKMTNKV